MTAQKENRTLIFCDGACSGNPGRGGWGTIVVNSDGQVSELAGASIATTNNQMELTAAIEGLKAVEKIPGPVTVYTDSTYVIQGITQWIHGWRKRGWKSSEGGDVLNRTFWERLYAVTYSRAADSKVSWHYVRGHSGIAGNERVDEIAVAYSKGIPLPLYAGPVSQYDVKVFEIPSDGSVPQRKKSGNSSGKSKAISYLSLVGKVAVRHSTWAECQSRINGVSGAKFKKAASLEEEKEILSGWGVDPNSF